MTYFEREARAQRASGVSIEDIAKILQCSEARIEKALLGDTVVRVIHRYVGDDVLYMFECLADASIVKMHRKSAGEMCFDILPPADCKDSEVWAEKLGIDLSEKGFNVVKAPRWFDE